MEEILSSCSTAVPTITTYPGSLSNLELHPNCADCEKVTGSLCKMYLEPMKQWTRLGGCAGKPRVEVEEEKPKGFVDPLKASKRQAKGVKQ